MAGPHQDQPLVRAGAALETADAALTLVHGRGATAQSIIQMADEFDQHNVVSLAPKAARNTWPHLPNLGFSTSEKADICRIRTVQKVNGPARI
jgi:hypothetical protein